MSKLLQVIFYHPFFHFQIIFTVQRDFFHNLISGGINEVTLLFHAFTVILGGLTTGSCHLCRNLLCIMNGMNQKRIPDPPVSFPVAFQSFFPEFPDHIVIQRQIETRKTGIALPPASSP